MPADGGTPTDGGTPADGAARAQIRSDLDATLVVVAGAGTGKTTALVERIVELVRSGRAPLREIAAITFTEAAAAELRQRIRDRIDSEALEHPDDARLAAARQEVDEAAICTLHAFAQRILVEHCVAAGIPPGFDVLDETAERADFDARFERFADTLLADPGAEPALVLGFSLGLTHDTWSRSPGPCTDIGTDSKTAGWPPSSGCGPGPACGPPPTRDPCSTPSTGAVSMGRWCSDDQDKLRQHLDRLAMVRRRARRPVTANWPTAAVPRRHEAPVQQATDSRRTGAEHLDEVTRRLPWRRSRPASTLLRATYHAVLGELGSRLARSS